jgi:hypothetical protein
MKKTFGRRPSASLVVSIVALVFAVSGSAMAASKLVSGNSLIKKQSLSGNRLMNHTLTGTQINLSKLGTVPSAANAATATTAGSAAISKVTYVTATGTLQPNAASPTLLIATCPAETTVIGGGGQVSDEINGVVIDTYPNSKTGWSVDFYNSGSAAISATTTAICAPASATAP